MAVFRVERTRDYTVMSNHHLRDKSLSLKAKGLLSLMLSLPEDWDYTLSGLARICQEGKDAVSSSLRQLWLLLPEVRATMPLPRLPERLSMQVSGLRWLPVASPPAAFAWAGWMRAGAVPIFGVARPALPAWCPQGTLSAWTRPARDFCISCPLEPDPSMPPL